MALRFTESFDHMAYADLTEKWTTWSPGAGGTYSFETGRNGNGFSMRISSGYASTLRKVLDSQGTWIIGMALKWVGTLQDQTLAAILDSGTAQCTLLVTSAGALRVYRGTTGGTILGTSAGGVVTQDAWYFVEWKTVIDNSAGTVDIRVNGASVLALDTQDTQDTANANANTISLEQAKAGTGTETIYDDVHFCDASGSIRNNFLGDCRAKALFTDGAGNYSQFTPSAGSNYENVDEAAPDDDTTYNQSSAVGNKDSFTMGDLAGGLSATILGIQACLSAKKTDAGGLTARSFVRISSTDYNGAIHSPSAGSYLYGLNIWEVNPNTAANFSVSEINALEPGYEHVS